MLFAVPAAYVGYERDTGFRAESQLNVGRLDVTAQALPGYATASQGLAQSYAAIVSADPILRPVAQRLGTSLSELRDSLSAAAIPDSTIFYVRADASDRDTAVARVRAASRQLTAYGRQQASVNTDQRRLLATYRRVQRELTALESSVGRLAARQRLDGPTAASRRRLAAARVRRAEVQLRADALADGYVRSRLESSATPGVRIVRQATVLDDDRLRGALAFGAIGALVGALDAVLLLGLLGRRRRRRAANQ